MLEGIARSLEVKYHKPLEVTDEAVDFIVAQGSEAGGHRGTYLRDPYDAMTGTLALVRLIVRRVKVPVVAAGGSD